MRTIDGSVAGLLPVARAALLSLPLAAASALAQEGPKPTPKGPAAAAAEEAATGDAGQGDAAEGAGAKRDALKVFLGRWRCEGKASTERGQDLPMFSIVKLEPILERTWLRVSYEQKKSKENPSPTKTEEIWGYDVGEGLYRRTVVDARGHALAGTSLGWLGDRFDWTMEAKRNGQVVRFKETYTKKGEREFEVLGAVGTGDGQWRVVYEGVCKK